MRDYSQLGSWALWEPTEIDTVESKGSFERKSKRLSASGAYNNAAFKPFKLCSGFQNHTPPAFDELLLVQQKEVSHGLHKTRLHLGVRSPSAPETSVGNIQAQLGFEDHGLKTRSSG